MTIFFSMQINGSHIRPNVKWAASLMIATNTHRSSLMVRVYRPRLPPHSRHGPVVRSPDPGTHNYKRINEHILLMRKLCQPSIYCSWRRYDNHNIQEGGQVNARMFPLLMKGLALWEFKPTSIPISCMPSELQVVAVRVILKNSQRLSLVSYTTGTCTKIRPPRDLNPVLSSTSQLVEYMWLRLT